ncbi:MAG: ABC transporter ATP-binding protein [Ignavibacterium sp.]|nr:MAG: ABC transporter ATP-binding protein [Ignavibacterium sp.]
MQSIIQIMELKKSYGDISAVNGITFSVNEGEMFGLVGPDGAGKTTTIRILCGLLSGDSGTVEVFGKDVSKFRKEIQYRIGYLSQIFSLYGDLSVDENIEFYAEINNVKDYFNRRNELLEFTRLTPFRNRLAENLSGGMKQKLALACSLIHRPKIIFLDEPTTGVDPVSRRDFWKILSDLQKEGITIFMSTPYLDEAERCNRVALMNEGELIAIDTPQKIKESTNKKVIEIISDDIKRSYSILKDEPHIDVQIFGDRINVMVDEPERELQKIESILNDKNISITSDRVVTPSLENIFIHLVKEAGY